MRWIASQSIYTPPRPRKYARYGSLWLWIPVSDQRMLPLRSKQPQKSKGIFLSRGFHQPWAWRRRLKTSASGVGWG